jgi:cytochrome c-type biogenesis protein CcmH/NrfG
LERRCAACYLGLVTARVALSIGALVVLGLGVYLLIAVQGQPGETAAAPSASPREPVVERAAPAARPAAAAPPTATRAPPPASPNTGAPSWVPTRPTAAPPPAAASDPAAPVEDLSGPKLDAVMAEANKAYDRGDYDDAKTIATRVLAREPTNVRMLRILVSASCIDGDSNTATASFAKLPPADQTQMRTRCLRYGVMFPGATAGQ